MISALVLAGGDSSRMGRTKALLEYDGRNFLESVCAGVNAAGVTETIVVLGASRAEVLAAWNPGEIRVAFNETPELGQIASVRAALKLVSYRSEAVMICLVDQPLIKPETYKLIADFWRSSRDFLVIPKCRRDEAPESATAGQYDSKTVRQQDSVVPPAGVNPLSFKRGHPIIIPRKYFQLCFEGPNDKGLHWVTHHQSVKVLDLVVADAGVIRDFDTPEEYQQLLGRNW
ncbi:MAG: nucleotidyltransferase family protein [Elusimicrobiota bacterium]